MIRVAFFAGFPFHGPILVPVRDALGDRAVTVLAGDRRAVVAFRPHVLVMASSAHLEYFRRHLSGAFAVNVRHGLIGKQGLRRLPGRATARRFDAVCVGDELRKAHYERAGARPDAFWETGYPQLDPLFRGAAAPVLPTHRGTMLAALRTARAPLVLIHDVAHPFVTPALARGARGRARGERRSPPWPRRPPPITSPGTGTARGWARGSCGSSAGPSPAAVPT